MRQAAAWCHLAEEGKPLMTDARYIPAAVRTSTQHMQNVRRDRAIELIDDYSDVVGALLDHCQLMDHREAVMKETIRHLVTAIPSEMADDPQVVPTIARALAILNGIDNAFDC